MPFSLKPSLREKWGSDCLCGLWLASASPVAGEILAGSGVDLIVIDAEHSPVGIASLVPLLQALEPYDPTALVRVPWNDAVAIKQFLDAGAQNLIVPMISTAQEAARAAAAMHYPAPAGPEGLGGERDISRGIGAALARASRWGRVPDYIGRASSSVSLIVQIETAEAVKNAREIVRTPGVDAVFVGPADLAGSLGCAGNPQDPRVVEAVKSVVAICKEEGIPVGVNAFDPAFASALRQEGADFLVIGADVSLLVSSSDESIKKFRANSKV